MLRQKYSEATKILVGGQKVSITDEIIGVSQLLGGHVSELPSPKSTPMVGGQVVRLARHGKLN